MKPTYGISTRKNGAGFQPFSGLTHNDLGLCPRLVWISPLALKKTPMWCPTGPMFEVVPGQDFLTLGYHPIWTERSVDRRK
jgi:hypothetical protein